MITFTHLTSSTEDHAEMYTFAEDTTMVDVLSNTYVLTSARVTFSTGYEGKPVVLVSVMGRQAHRPAWVTPQHLGSFTDSKEMKALVRRIAKDAIHSRGLLVKDCVVV